MIYDKQPIHYHLFLASIKLSETVTTAAGVPGYQGFTPALDTEWIMYGKHLSDFPESCSLDMPSGAASPAIAVRALLLDFADKGHPIHLHIYNLGVAFDPAFEPQFIPEGWTASYDKYSKRHRRVWDMTAPDYYITATEGLTLQAAAADFYAAYVKDRTARHIIAECVPNGTITASTIWSVTQDPELDPQYPPGSSADPDVVARRQALMVHRYVAAVNNRESKRLDPQPQTWGHTATFLLASELMDPFQYTLWMILRQSGKHAFDLVGGSKIWLGGGVQMLAPFLWAVRTRPVCDAFLRQNFEIATTHAVMKFFTRPGYSGENFEYLDFNNAAIRFTKSTKPAWQLYAEGHAKEGLGMGALMRLWEDTNCARASVPRRRLDDIWHVLDNALSVRTLPCPA